LYGFKFGMSTIAQSLAFELKGNLFTLLVMKVLTPDLSGIRALLDDKLKQAPQFFQQAPIVIDLQAVAEADTSVNLAELLDLLRQQGVVPVGVRGGSDSQQKQALQLGLGVFTQPKPERAKRPPKSEPEPEAEHTNEPATTEHAEVIAAEVAGMPAPAHKIVTHPIRSGQQIVAPEGDLIILSTVSPGAEVLASGNIHIYGALRGRALAGVNGNVDARIFCQILDAELVSVAGHYQINEGLKEAWRNKPAHIYLDADTLTIQPLETYPR